jgi:hypothetical protein
MHTTLSQMCQAICKYYEYNFTVEPSREGYFVPSGAKKNMKMKKTKKDSLGENENELSCDSPVEAVNGLKLSCHFLSTLISHFSCVSPKDTVYGVIFLSTLIDNSLTLLRQENTGIHSLSPQQIQLLQACTHILSSYLAYILIHKHHVVCDEIFTLKHIVLRDILMTLFEDSLTAGDDYHYLEEGGGTAGGDGTTHDTSGSSSSCSSSSSGSSGSSGSGSGSSMKCIDMTHPLLASYVCAVTLPRLGIACTCTPLHTHPSTSTPQLDGLATANEWYDHQVERQAKHFSDTDLFSLDMAQLWSWMDITHSPDKHLYDSAGNAAAATATIIALGASFPIERWPSSRTGKGDDLPNVHEFFRSERDMKDASTSFILQSASCFSLSAEGAQEQEEEEVDEEGGGEGGADNRRRVDAADRVFSYDICVVVMEYVSFKRVCRLACVNKQFALAATCPIVWARQYRARFDVLFDISPAPLKTKKTKVNKTKPHNATVEVGVEMTSKHPIEWLCQHCFPPLPDTTLAHVAPQARAKKTTCCNGLAKKHNWLLLFQV